MSCGGKSISLVLMPHHFNMKGGDDMRIELYIEYPVLRWILLLLRKLRFTKAAKEWERVISDNRKHKYMERNAGYRPLPDVSLYYHCKRIRVKM